MLFSGSRFNTQQSAQQKEVDFDLGENIRQSSRLAQYLSDKMVSSV